MQALSYGASIIQRQKIHKGKDIMELLLTSKLKAKDNQSANNMS